MNEHIEQYLKTLNLPAPVRARVDEVSTAFELLSRAPLDRVFISDAIDETGEARFEDLWGFSGEYWMWARNFMQQFDLDISPYTNAVLYIGIKYEGMKLAVPATFESRMSLEIETAKVRYSSLSATGQNCDALMLVLNDLLLPNLKTTGDVEGRDSRTLR